MLSNLFTLVVLRPTQPSIPSGWINEYLIILVTKRLWVVVGEHRGMKAIAGWGIGPPV